MRDAGIQYMTGFAHHTVTDFLIITQGVLHDKRKGN